MVEYKVIISFYNADVHVERKHEARYRSDAIPLNRVMCSLNGAYLDRRCAV